jgi:hypothetical protein
MFSQLFSINYNFSPNKIVLTTNPFGLCRRIRNHHPTFLQGSLSLNYAKGLILFNVQNALLCSVLRSLSITPSQSSNKFSKTDGFCRCWLVHSLGVGNTISNIQTATNPYVHLRLLPYIDIVILCPPPPISI